MRSPNPRVRRPRQSPPQDNHSTESAKAIQATQLKLLDDETAYADALRGKQRTYGVLAIALVTAGTGLVKTLIVDANDIWGTFDRLTQQRVLIVCSIGLMLAVLGAKRIYGEDRRGIMRRLARLGRVGRAFLYHPRWIGRLRREHYQRLRTGHRRQRCLERGLLLDEESIMLAPSLLPTQAITLATVLYQDAFERLAAENYKVREQIAAGRRLALSGLMVFVFAILLFAFSVVSHAPNSSTENASKQGSTKELGNDCNSRENPEWTPDSRGERSGQGCNEQASPLTTDSPEVNEGTGEVGEIRDPPTPARDVDPAATQPK